MAFEDIKIRNYDGRTDRAGVEDLERRCEVGPGKHVFLFTDSMGDPICRIRNSPMYKMLVAECNNDLVGIIRGTIKRVTLHNPPKNVAKVGYILGLRVSPLHRRRGIGYSLVHHLEEWFVANQVDYAYMATEKDNKASVKLFVDKLGYVKFRTPTILVHPVNRRCFDMPPDVTVAKLKVEQAELLYRMFMGGTEFFPHDINKVLGNKLSLGTWVAYTPVRGASEGEFGLNGRFPDSWAMVSVWNSGSVFKLRMGKAPLSCFLYGLSSRFMDRVLPCFKVPSLPDFFHPFGFYFMYGMHHEGPLSGKLVRTLCKHVHNMAATESGDCKLVVTEVGGSDGLRSCVPNWKLLSCPEDLWCIKPLKDEERSTRIRGLMKPTRKPTRALFVDPREV
ncbi:hypothetical protein RJ639_003712 [Escallonia herrerae]|uniref:N-acetyltransferase domain-containing protein n=1 Tax=Escallonia herrerae TaxID=1293975 RepID=A0AA88W5I5_9ASTE|nr:hypothetical protein RJ639_003712 [Escallonia herrerae]